MFHRPVVEAAAAMLQFHISIDPAGGFEHQLSYSPFVSGN